jgi:signal transduction histidine kinase
LATTDGGIDRIREDLTGFEHDILHELSTIAVLAELLGKSGMPASQRQLRARQLVCEIGWLRSFVRAEQNRLLRRAAPARPSSEVRIHALVADIVGTIRLLTKARLHVVVEPVAVCGDRIALGRALRNLIWNAIDAAGPNGEVELAVRAEDRQAAVAIENNVAPFATRGEGMGLDLVRQIVSQLGGTLRIESSAERYRVTFRLPLASAGEDELCAS